MRSLNDVKKKSALVRRKSVLLLILHCPISHTTRVRLLGKMVESKIFYGTVEQGNDVNPPFVPVQAVDVWHLEAVPVPTAPSYLHDEQEAEPVVPSIVVATTGEERTERPSQSIMLDDEKDPEKKLQMGAGVASGVIGL